MPYEQRKGSNLQDLHQQLAEVLPQIQLASQWNGKDGKFKGITPDGTVYVTTVKHIDAKQHRHKQKLGHINDLTYGGRNE
jgi:hypothetical protein